MKRLVGRALGAALVLSGPAGFAKPSPDVVRTAAQSVVRVLADGCPGDARTRQGSGFVWPDAGSVVTALHVVADCTRVTVEFVDRGAQRGATVDRVLRRADLALLKVDRAPGTPALPHVESVAEQEDLAAIGMPLNVRNWQETYGSRALNVRVLDDILNEDVRAQIRRLGAPDVRLEIFRLTATVKPGSSGGPVINRSGAVVGVVDGGLDGGSSSLNWAVPSRFLPELAASPERGGDVGLGPAVDVAFAFSGAGTQAAAAGVNDEIACGGRRFFRLATRALHEIVGSVQQPGTVDDPAGFLRLVQGFSAIIAPERLAELRFDLYVDEATSATIAVPRSMRIRDDNGFCIAAAERGDVSLLFASLEFDPLSTNVQLVSSQFEAAAGRQLRLGVCQPDVAWMEPVPHVRFDGLIARRTGAGCLDGFSGEQVYGVVGYFARDDTFMGAVALNREFFSTGIGGDPEITLAWASAALAILISTYQI